MTNEQLQHLIVVGSIAQLEKEAQEKINDTAMALRRVIQGGGVEGAIALALVGTEAAAEIRVDVPPAQDDSAELEYLRFFYINSDFGPAHEDVVEGIEADFTNATGKAVPDHYKIGG